MAIGRNILVFLIIFSSTQNFAQVRIGEWRAHLNYSRALKSVEAGDRIYCATENGIFHINKNDNSLTTLSKVDGLSGVEVVTIDYDAHSKNVFVSYEGGLVDMLGFDYVVNIPYIADAISILGDKSVFNFYFDNGLAYMATNFGIVVYDIARREIKETYLNLDERGNQLAISDVAVYKGRVYAASKIGLRSGSLNNNLLDFSFWQTDLNQECDVLQIYNDKLLLHLADNRILAFDGNNFVDFAPMKWAQVRHMDVFQNKLVVTKNNNIVIYDSNFQKDSLNTGAPSHGLLDANGIIWLSNRNNGLIKFGQTTQYPTPNGPGGPTAWDFDYANGQLWVASGGVDNAYNPRFLNNGVYVFKDQKWTNYNGTKKSEIIALRDLHRVRVDASRNIKYVASYNAGLAVFDENDNVTVFNRDNSEGALTSPNNSTDPNAWILIAGIDLDTQGNLWMSLQYAENQLAVLMANGKWNSFNLGSEKRVTEVMVDHEGQKWIAVHLDGIYVFDDGGTPMNTTDDRVRRVNNTVGNGNLPSSDVFSMVTDKEGDVWIGTGDGVCVIYSPKNVFSTEFSFDVSRPTIQKGIGELGYLLEGQKVNCITIDGANQKWIGTDNGIFVTNPDGDEILYRFTVDNSPLLSNIIRRIGIDEKTGEVFFATDKGIISYRAAATEGNGEQEAVYVFPNPVRPGYTGPIAITGLTSNANVKITDISGNLVYETIAQGGTAVWYGKTFGGNEVSSGVYLAFSSDTEGKETYISKIMIIR